MLPEILVGVVVVLIALVVFIATRPAHFTVTRSATIYSPADHVFSLVNDLRAWKQWSPWENRDPNMSKTYSGPATGIGAEYAWSGNKDVGEGRMQITESRPSEHIEIHLEFIKPFKATNTTTFTFTPRDNGTHVTWNMTGMHNFVGKAMSLFMNMDNMIGRDFEQGLADMKVAAEKTVILHK